jgi:hypothetical protein
MGKLYQMFTEFNQNLKNMPDGEGIVSHKKAKRSQKFKSNQAREGILERWNAEHWDDGMVGWSEN